MNQQADTIQSMITFGTVKVLLDLTQHNLTNGQVRKAIDVAIHCMYDNDLEEITVKTSGYSLNRDNLMKGYDFHRYGGQHIHYRLVNPKYEEQSF